MSGRTRRTRLRRMRSREKPLKESQARAAILEKNLQDTKRLAQLKTEAALAQTPAPKRRLPSACRAEVSIPLPSDAVKIQGEPNRNHPG